MSAKIVDGKKPLSAKKRSGLDSKNADAFGNKLALTADVKKELEEQGLVPRFVNAKQLTEMGGYHAKGWRVYQRPHKDKASGTIDSEGSLMGNDPNVFIRRGDA